MKPVEQPTTKPMRGTSREAMDDEDFEDSVEEGGYYNGESEEVVWGRQQS